MPRRRRHFVPGLTQHVVHRGVDRRPVFRASSDFSVYLNILRTATLSSRVAIHAYVLMSNHIHLMATPEDENGLSLMMRDVGRAYVKFFNRRHERAGALWDGRFHTSLLTTDHYWLTCLRYVELNPVRAGLAKSPEEYRWSSYRAHALGASDGLIIPHALFDTLGRTPPERQAAWREVCRAPIPEEKLVEFRHFLSSNPVSTGLVSGSQPGPDPDLLGF